MESIQTHPQNQLSPVIREILTKRGYSTEKLADFFSWDLHQLPKLTEMQDMQKASARIIKALDDQTKIGIYGDYDVDGTTSCALFYRFFQMLGVEVDLVQPSRFVEGYGIHPPAIEKAIENGIDLLITVDCGITNNETADYALERGLDLIITDHHADAKPEMPKAYAVVNPNRRDEPVDSELKALAGVGVAFAVCLQVKMDLEARGDECPSLYPLLQYVAIGTICDLAKLNPMNLKLSRHGLKLITKTEYKGIRTFFNRDELNVPFVPSEKISFNMGPMINSKGRLDHPERALNLLTTDDEAIAKENYAHLEISNQERKFIQAEVFNEAKKKVLSQMNDKEMLINIIYEPHWHEGVIGIVASKLVETFEVPAIVFTNAEDEGVIKASARSAGELNLFEELKKCDDLFSRFGGHKAAAGLSMPAHNLQEFITRMNSQLKDIPAIIRTVQNPYDAEIKFESITPKLLQELSMLEPFGMENERPTFIMRDVKIDSYKILKDVHVKWTLSSKKSPQQKLQGISFNFIGKWGQLDPIELYNKQGQMDLVFQFQLGINRFNGNEYIQLMISKIS